MISDMESVPDPNANYVYLHCLHHSLAVSLCDAGTM